VGCHHYRLSDGTVVYWKYARLEAFKVFARGDLGCGDVSVRWESSLIRSGPGSYFAQGCGRAAWYDCREEISDAPDEGYETYRSYCERRVTVAR
jgi:hypothetical protein